MSGSWITWFGTSEFAYVVVFSVIGVSLLTAYIENIVPLAGIVVIVICMSVLSIVVTAIASGDADRFMRELLK